MRFKQRPKDGKSCNHVTDLRAGFVPKKGGEEEGPHKPSPGICRISTAIESAG